MKLLPFSSKILASLCLACFLSGACAQAKLPVKSGEFGVRSFEEMDLPEEYKQHLRERVMKERAASVIDVSDHEIADFDSNVRRHKQFGKKLEVLIDSDKLSFAPATISGSSQRAVTFIAALKAGTRVSSGFTGIERLFSHTSLGEFFLEEIDLPSSGGGAVTYLELVNADVNGSPANFISKRGGSDSKAISTLSWTKGGRVLVIHSKRIDEKSRQVMLQIARDVVF